MPESPGKVSPSLMKTCKVTESSSTAVKPVPGSKQHILRPAEMAEPNRVSLIKLVGGGFFQRDAAEPGQDTVATR